MDGYISLILIVATVSSGFLKVWQKYESRFFEADTFTVLIQVLSALLMVPLYILFSPKAFAFTPFYITLVVAAGAAWYIGSLVTNRSLKTTDLTLREPIIQTRLVFVILFSAVFLGEHVSFFNALGAGLILLGAIISSYKPGTNYLELKRDGVWISFLSAFLVGIAYTADKYGLNYMDVFAWSLFMYAIPLIFLTPKISRAYADVVAKPAVRIASLTAVIFLYTLVYVGLLYVFQHTQLSQTFPLSQLSSVFVFLGGLYLGERSNMRNRTIGACIAIVGGVIIFMG